MIIRLLLRCQPGQSRGVLVLAGKEIRVGHRGPRHIPARIKRVEASESMWKRAA